MASEHSSFDLQSLLADAQDLVDESFVARALLQPETDPWERFPFGLLYPTYDCLNEAHHSFLIGSAANSLAVTEPSIKTEPVEDVDPLSTVSQPQYEDELDKYLDFTHEDLAIARPTTTTVLLSSSPIEDSDAPLPHSNQEPAGYSHVKEQLEYPDTTTISSSSSTTECAPSLQLDDHVCFTDHLNHPITSPATTDSNSFSITDTSPATTASSLLHSFSSFHAPTASPPATIASPNSSLFSSSFASIAIPSSISSELSSSNAPSINTEDVPCSTLNCPDDGTSLADKPVHYTFVDPHEKPRKRRTKGIKNSTPIACTFCRRRKIRCGGPQEGDGVCKSCIRLNHKGECVFPAVSYRGQRLGGSNSSSKRKSTSKSKGTAKCGLPPSESS